MSEEWDNLRKKLYEEVATIKKGFETGLAAVKKELSVVKDKLGEVTKQNIIMGKDIETILKMGEENSKAREELEKFIFKGNGQPSLLSRVVQNGTWIKIYGTIIILIVGVLITGYIKM